MEQAPEQYGAWLTKESAEVAALIRAAGIKAN